MDQQGAVVGVVGTAWSKVIQLIGVVLFFLFKLQLHAWNGFVYSSQYNYRALYQSLLDLEEKLL